jgi:hypothetical protein
VAAETASAIDRVSSRPRHHPLGSPYSARKRTRIEAIAALTPFSVSPRPRASGVVSRGNSFLAAFDRAALAAIFAVGLPFGFAPD